MGKLFSGYGLATLPLDGSEQVSILQGGINKKTQIGNLSADGLIQIYDPLGEFFTSLATATAYIRTFYPVGSLTDKSFNDKVYSFTVPAGSNFSSANFFLADGINYVQRTANIIDKFGLIGTFGDSAFLSSTGNNILGNCTFGISAFVNSPGNNILGNCTFSNYAFVSSTGSNTLGDCTFGISAFSNSSSNNILGNCTFGISAFVNSLGINTLSSCTFGNYAFSNSYGINTLGNCTFGDSAFINSTGSNTLSNCTFGDSAFSDSSSNNILGNCTFGDSAFPYSLGNNRLRNCTFGDGAFVESTGSNTLGDCIFGYSAFSDSSSSNTLGNCTFGDSAFVGSTGSNTLGDCTFGDGAFSGAAGVHTIKNILLTNLIHSFAEFSTGRFYLNGTIGTTTAAQYTNFFLTSTAEIRARRASYTNNAGGIEGDLVTARTNGATLFFGGIDKEDVSNKVTTLAWANNTTYPTTLTVSNAITAGVTAGVTGVELLVNKGVANGYVPLNASTLIDSTYLPAYVDDVLEFANLAAFPVTGETGKIYIAINSGKQYRWSGTVYVQITNGLIATTNDLPDSLNKRYQTDNQQAFNDATSSIQTQLNTKETTITATTSADFWSGAKTFINFATTVRATVLTGLSNATSQVIVATDSVVLALGYLQAQITSTAAAIALKVTANTAITGATNTKLTYDSKGLVTSGTSATTADINDSTNRRYITDAQLTIVGNTSNTNTGDNATNTQYSGLATNATHTGDATGSTALTLATVNATTGTFGLAGSIGQFVVNAKGLITSAVNVAISITASQVSDFTAGVNALITGKLTKSGDTITGDIANTSTGYFQIPSGTTAQRPVTPLEGMRRFNTTTIRDEFYVSGTWKNHARLDGETFTGAIAATNLSNTNTGDDATNTQYSGLAASKENAITATTSADFWSGAKTFINFATTVRSTVLTGLSLATSQAIVATDSVLQALGYLQGQINANISSIALKSNIANPTFTGTITTPALNMSGQIASTVPYLDASKNLISSSVTPNQLGYLDATSSIQTQLNTKGVGTIKGTLPATAGLIPFASGTLDTVTTNSTFKFDSTTGAINIGTIPSGYAGLNTFSKANNISAFISSSTTSPCEVQCSNTTNTMQIGVEGSTANNRMVGTKAFNLFFGTYLNYGMTFHTNNKAVGEVSNAGNWMIGGGGIASARVNIIAGTAIAGTAPLKLTAGTNLTVVENGAFEFDGTNLFFTVGGVRKTVTLV